MAITAEQAQNLVNGLSFQGDMGKSGENQVIQSPAFFQPQDATGTPVVSPKASVGTTNVPLIVPINAVVLTVTPEGADLLIGYGANDGTDGNGSFLVRNGERFPLPVKLLSLNNLANTYSVNGSTNRNTTVNMKTTSGTATVYFGFEMLMNSVGKGA